MAHEDTIGRIEGDTIYWPITDIQGNPYTWPNATMHNIGGNEFVIAPAGMPNKQLVALLTPLTTVEGDLIVKDAAKPVQKVSAPPEWEVQHADPDPLVSEWSIRNESTYPVADDES